MEVVKVQFKKAGKRYYFSTNNLEIKNDDFVVVETIRGIELGKVIGIKEEIEDENIATEMKPVIRIATEEDLTNYENNKKEEENILKITKKLIKKHNLDMKLLACEYTLDKNKLIIYFESEGRVDFRDLVKDLAEEFKVRIELRQVGSRDGAKFIGGLGPCGLIMCCNTHIGEFDNVSIKMAKNQNLSLNPQKISGTCGKLLCCIKYEDDLYTELKEKLPDVGDHIITNIGEAKVLASDVINKVFKVKYQDDTINYVKEEEIISFIRKHELNGNNNQ